MVSIFSSVSSNNFRNNSCFAFTPRCGKNIITDFIRKSLFSPELVYSTSDLGKILEKFNSSIQGHKLIIMNEAGMLSGEWHKLNDHLKSLITEDYVSIEHKGLENQECGHFPGFIVLSNYDALICVKQEDGRIVCLDISPRCKDQIEKPSCAILYQKYHTWCEANDEKPFSNNNFGKKISQVNIERKRASGGKREWQYIFDRSKIMAKLRESVGDIEEFSDTPHAEISTNISTEIPVFNTPEIVKAESEKNIAKTLITDHIKKGKKIVSAPPITKMIQDLFDSITDQSESSVASSSKSIDISLPPKIVDVEVIDNKSKSLKIIKLVSDEAESVNNKPEISPDLPANDELKSSNEEVNTQLETSHLRKKAIKLGEDPDKFVTITKKDKLDFIAFHDRMQTNARMCSFAKEAEEDPSKYMDMTVRERLISEEIIRHSFEEDEITSSWLDTDEE
ncbi:10371_t:CDS:2 [Cetraspora pellucida]|uniref:10371_t:CDS:1 n=1 Tax=Cetraspora pellucida TaxID=1433469 RepID=A0A9N9DGD1_9GLOM|nr:10371_t:CDS:2 [Cetraspora pellucida]